MKRKGPRIEVPVQGMPARVTGIQDELHARLATQQNFDHLDGQLQLFARAFQQLFEPELDEEEPLAALNLAVKFFIRKRKRRLRYNARVKFDPPGDAEGISHYVVQGVACNSGGTPVDTDDDGKPLIMRRVVHVPDDLDDDDKLKALFRNLDRPKAWYYKFRARPVGENGKKGSWTAWTTPLNPYTEVADTVLAPINLSVTQPVPRRVKATWDDPDEDDGVDRYQVEVWVGAVLKETGKTRSERYVYRVPKADRKQTHTIKVRSVNEYGITSGWAQGNANDEDDITPGTVVKHAGPAMTGSYNQNYAPSDAEWLKCTGTVQYTSTFAALFAEIGYTYGGAGSEFYVPDFRNRKAKGAGSLYALGSNEGLAEGSRVHTGPHTDDETNTTPDADYTNGGGEFGDQSNTPNSDSTSGDVDNEQAHVHGHGGIGTTGAAQDWQNTTQAGGGLNAGGHVHGISGYSDQSQNAHKHGPGHGHGHNHGGHGHNHSHGGHNHGHHHGQHKHKHGGGHGTHSAKPHLAMHYYIKT